MRKVNVAAYIEVRENEFVPFHQCTLADFEAAIALARKQDDLTRVRDYERALEVYKDKTLGELGP